MCKTGKGNNGSVMDVRKALYILYTKLEEIKENFYLKNWKYRSDTYCRLRDIFLTGLLDMANKLSADAGYIDEQYTFNSKSDCRYPDSCTTSNTVLYNEGIIRITASVESEKPIVSLSSLVGAVASLFRGIKNLKMEESLRTKIVDKEQSVFCDHGDPETDCVSFEVRVSCSYNLRKEDISLNDVENIQRADFYTILTLAEYCLRNKSALWNKIGLKIVTKLIKDLKIEI